MILIPVGTAMDYGVAENEDAGGDLSADYAD